MVCAYLTLVMKGDEYVIGALVLAQSLKKSGTEHTIACMVTSDVSEQARKDLEKVFDAVHLVEYYKVPVVPLRTDKAQGMYGSWMSISLTWYRCLGLVNYEKVFLLDSDVAVLRCMDNIFRLPTPAGCFHSFWKESGYYNGLKHGGKVDSNNILHALNDKRNSVVCIGNGLLLSPSGDGWSKFEECMDKFKQENNGSLGFRNSLSGINEQMVAYFYVSIGSTWTQIGIQYQIIPWHMVHDSDEPPYLFHYFNMKPWRMGLDTYADLQVWWRFAKSVIEEYEDCIRYIPEDLRLNLDNIETFLPEFCFWCKKGDHTFISKECGIKCSDFRMNIPGKYGFSRIPKKREVSAMRGGGRGGAPSLSWRGPPSLTGPGQPTGWREVAEGTSEFQTVSGLGRRRGRGRGRGSSYG